jgi:hypothetical protein
MRRWVVAVLAGALAACGPGDTRKLDPAAAHAPQPSPAAAATFAQHCTWGEVRGAQYAVWSYACDANASGVRLVADDALPGFRIAGDFAERPVAIRVFDKPAGAPLAAILPAVRAASPAPGTGACEFTPATGADHEGRNHWVLAPVGAARAAYDAAAAGDSVPPNPCGDLGIGPTGDRYFTEIAPDKVAYVDAGSEIQIFDATTLRALGDGVPAH